MSSQIKVMFDVCRSSTHKIFIYNQNVNGSVRRYAGYVTLECQYQKYYDMDASFVASHTIHYLCFVNTQTDIQNMQKIWFKMTI